jgi:hypothetical protein
MAETSPAEMLSDIQSARVAKSGGIQLTAWEEEFVENAARLLAGGRVLSDNQRAKLEQIWDKI